MENMHIDVRVYRVNMETYFSNAASMKRGDMESMGFFLPLVKWTFLPHKYSFASGSHSNPNETMPSYECKAWPLLRLTYHRGVNPCSLHKCMPFAKQVLQNCYIGKNKDFQSIKQWKVAIRYIKVQRIRAFFIHNQNTKDSKLYEQYHISLEAC